ncbi:hypothetical protein DL93DRAFT_1115983 [Clavulina sp. PMI_390]|nr:hypothetical protein DL93DRAFT_1115983 [Clavulina sp. PMI_390]
MFHSYQFLLLVVRVLVISELPSNSRYHYPCTSWACRDDPALRELIAFSLSLSPFPYPSLHSALFMGSPPTVLSIPQSKCSAFVSGPSPRDNPPAGAARPHTSHNVSLLALASKLSRVLIGRRASPSWQAGAIILFIGLPCGRLRRQAKKSKIVERIIVWE